MNAVEIEVAISELADAPFDAVEFPYAFLAAFGNKETTIKRLRSGESNRSDVPGGVLQRNNIHLAVAPEGEVGATLRALRESPQTTKGKAKFILATDGHTLEAEELVSNETIVCEYTEFPQKLGFFLPLAGITTLKEIKDNPIDIRATSRLNKLYVELLRENPEWATDERREAMNHFMARLIFCFFAEDTGIFHGKGLFTQTVEQFSERDGSNAHEIIGAIFRAMNVPLKERASENTPNWANNFPYVNGGLFSGDASVPRFTRAARGYLTHAGGLNWQEINPDIFGSMIQAVADDEERGALGMHYTSVPNILKVLNPLFLDDLRAKLEEAGENTRMLLNLRKRMSRIRVFDPACGSGNFLVIAYKEMRAIEAEINQRRGEKDRRSDIRLTNFRGIEIRSFPAEIARLALIIAEFQCDVRYRGQKEALLEFLPLDAQNWIVCGNALRMDWLSICPPTGTKVKLAGDDLFNTPLDQAQIDFENEGGETYICGNPPYKGTKNQNASQKSDIDFVFSGHTGAYKSVDYVACWFIKACEHMKFSKAKTAFVSTNSICQGSQVPIVWPRILKENSIHFAYTSFTWSNLAAYNAGVIVVIIGIGEKDSDSRKIFCTERSGAVSERITDHINPYLISGESTIVKSTPNSVSGLPKMVLGNQPYDGGFLILESDQIQELDLKSSEKEKYIKQFMGSSDLIRGVMRYCLWLNHNVDAEVVQNERVRERINLVKNWRLASKRPATRSMASRPHQFCEMRIAKKHAFIVPIRSSENRYYLPVGIIDSNTVASNLAYVLYDSPIWCISLIASRIHLVWISTVCGRMKTDYSYSNKMGWNTFPVPSLTDQNKADLTRCAENILLAREAHFPATIANLYDPEKMPENLRRAHEENDETLERIYIGRRFKNDTERLEKLFEMYLEATAHATQPIT